MRNNNKQCILHIFTLFFIVTTCFSQTITFSGKIIDNISKEALIGAYVYDLQGNVGTSTNEYGFYSLTILPPFDTINLVYSYVGYKSDTIILKSVSKSKDFTVALSPTLENVIEITDFSSNIENQLNVGQFKIDVSKIYEQPLFLGEPDILKILQLTPGVQGGNEGLSGLYVRGGSPDQNLILMDDIPIYNSTHALGLFSIFNPDAVNDVNLIKAGFPARYGGRLSSVLDIRLRDGNLNEFEGKASVGLISSSIKFEGPLVKDKISFIISGRRSYPDLIARPFLGFEKFKSFFYDLNTKLRFKANDKTNVYFTGYFGSDQFELGQKQSSDREDVNGVDWNNSLLGLKMTHQYNAKIFSVLSLTLSDYKLGVNNFFKTPNYNLDTKYNSGISDYRLSYSLDYSINPNHYLKAGVVNTLHSYNPGSLSALGEVNNIKLDSLISIEKLLSNEFESYLEYIWSPSKKMRMNLGVRSALFTINKKTYSSLQPRISIAYQIGEKSFLKLSFASMAQFINLLTSEAFSLPTDQWVPSTDRITPQNSIQYTGGISKSIYRNLDLSVEIFYKKLKNVISLKEGENFIQDFSTEWEDKITQGKGKVYGLEFLLRRNKGRINGWIGYTWSKNQRQFDDINFGRWFPFQFDRRHDASIVLKYKCRKAYVIGFNWVYGTGNAVTLATQKYAITPDYDQSSNDILQLTSGERLVIDKKNNYRLTNYHRLDLSISYKKKLVKGMKSNLTFSIFNVYNHINPYFVRVQEKAVLQSDQSFKNKLVLQEVGLLPFLPSLSYSVSF